MALKKVRPKCQFSANRESNIRNFELKIKGNFLQLNVLEIELNEKQVNQLDINLPMGVPNLIGVHFRDSPGIYRIIDNPLDNKP